MVGDKGRGFCVDRVLGSSITDDTVVSIRVLLHYIRLSIEGLLVIRHRRCSVIRQAISIAELRFRTIASLLQHLAGTLVLAQG